MRHHDQPVKLLLQTFFVEFLAAFAGDIHRDLNPTTIQFLDKEWRMSRRSVIFRMQTKGALLWN